MEHDETGCQAAPEGPILCVNNCGFFGSVATINMCSKCYNDTILKQEQAKIAQTSIENIVNGTSSGNDKEPLLVSTLDLKIKPIEPTTLFTPATSSASGIAETVDVQAKQGPSRCTSCNNKVGLTGFNCRCGNLFCGTHRYSDKHDCPFDYRNAGRFAIAKANPVIKADKLDKI